MPVLTTRGIINLLREVFPRSKFTPVRWDEFVCSILIRAEFQTDVYPHRIRVQPLLTRDTDAVLSATLKWEEPTYDREGIESWICKDTLQDATDLDEILGWISWLRTAHIIKNDVAFDQDVPAHKMPFTAKLLWSTYVRDRLDVQDENVQQLWVDPPWTLKTRFHQGIIVVRNSQPGNLTQPMMTLVPPEWAKPVYAVIVTDIEETVHNLLVRRGIYNPELDPGPIDVNGEPLWAGQTTALDLDKWDEVLALVKGKRRPRPFRIIVSPRLHAELSKRVPMETSLKFGAKPMNLFHTEIPVVVEPLIKDNEIFIVYDDGSRQKQRI